MLPVNVNRLAPALGILVLLLLGAWLAGWTGPDLPPARIEALWVLLTALPWALLWIGAAVGYGWLCARLLAPNAKDPVALQLGLGVTALLLLDRSLGALGVLQIGGSVGGWILIALGLGLLIPSLQGGPGTPRRSATPDWLIWTAVPAVTVMLLAACSAPGALWTTEFGGYDALSYHLQLPAEWWAAGRIMPLDHNVYSHLPGYVEAAYYHLYVLMGDAPGAAYACQLLHVLFALLTGVIVYRLGRSVTQGPGASVAGPVAAVLLVATPWVVVVGSLAYDEMVTTLLLASGLMVIRDSGFEPWRRGLLIGILAAGACGAKLTSTFLVALPLGILLLMCTPLRRWHVAVGTGVLGALLVLSPYLISNTVTRSNPVFPFATQVLDKGHWSDEQIDAWRRGHAPEAGLSPKVRATWDQWWRFGLGTNPSPEEPWIPQWLVLPWLTLAGLILMLTDPPTRRWAVRLGVVLALQLVLWAALTHGKSRFLLPAVVPCALIIGLGADRLITGRAGRSLCGLLLTVWSLGSILIYAREPDGTGAPAARIGAIELITGEVLEPAQRRELALAGGTAAYLNWMLPQDSRVLLIGDAAPFYYRGDVTYQTTWDRGPLSVAMRAAPHEPAAWIDTLASQGFTHLLVDATMLRRWQEAGWNDELITAQRVLDAAQQHARLEMQFPGQMRQLMLYRLDENR
jgi:hypothetical protein